MEAGVDVRPGLHLTILCVYQVITTRRLPSMVAILYIVIARSSTVWLVMVAIPAIEVSRPYVDRFAMAMVVLTATAVLAYEDITNSILI